MSSELKSKNGNASKHVAQKCTSAILDFFKSNRFIYLVFFWFVFQAVYMVVKTPYAVAPDEFYHFRFIKVFAENGWTPFLREESADLALGETQHTPFFLYHYLMSFPYRLFESTPTGLRFLRLINISFGCLSLYLVFQIGKELKVNPIARNLAVFMFSNTLMFTFLSGSINYDNLFIAASLAAVLLVLKLWQEFVPEVFLLFLIVLSAGLLIKLSFLPIFVAAVFILLIRYWRKPWIFIVKLYEGSWTKRRWILLLVLILLLVPLMQRYVVNQVSYGTYAPECTQVMSKSKCLKNPIFSRGVELEKITNPAITLDRVDYLERWSKNMSNRTFGIFGHRSFDPHRYIYVVMILGLFLGAIGFIRYVNKKDIGILILLFFSSFYIFVLLRQHYSEYLRTGIAELAVQGRYSFAVLPLVYIIALHYTLKLLRHNSLRLAYILCLLTLFLASCLPTFIIRSGPGWSEPRIEQFP